MTDATVVSLCRQYLETWDRAVLQVLCDRLEELGETHIRFATLMGQMTLGDARVFFKELMPNARMDMTVPAILKLYGGDQ